MMSSYEVRNWMRKNVMDFVDKQTLEVNCTNLAESCASALNISECLEDECSEIWDIALEVSEWYENPKGKQGYTYHEDRD